MQIFSINILGNILEISNNFLRNYFYCKNIVHNTYTKYVLLAYCWPEALIENMDC